MAELYSLTVMLSDGGAPVVLMFDGARNARAVFDRLVTLPIGEGAERVKYADDFGTEGWVWADTVAGVVLQNAARAFEGGIRRALLQAEANAKASRQAEARQPGGGLVRAPGGFLNG